MVDAPAAGRQAHQQTKSHSSAVSSLSWDKYANANRLAPIRRSSIIAAFDKVILVLAEAVIVPVAKCITVIMSCPQINNEQNWSKPVKAYADLTCAWLSLWDKHILLAGSTRYQKKIKRQAHSRTSMAGLDRELGTDCQTFHSSGLRVFSFKDCTAQQPSTLPSSSLFY